MAHLDISDKHFQFRCCWTCDHCVLDIAQGYLCTAVPASIGAIQLAPEGLDANVEIHKDRRNCKAYKRG